MPSPSGDQVIGDLKIGLDVEDPTERQRKLYKALAEFEHYIEANAAWIRSRPSGECHQGRRVLLHGRHEAGAVSIFAVEASIAGAA